MSLIINEMSSDTLKICKDYQVSIKSIIHGDCTRNNCIVLGDRIIFIDFDNFKIGDPLEDLANAANSVLYDDEISSIQEKKSIFRNLFCNYGLKNIDIKRIENYMKINCIIELYKHRENYRYLRRTPGTKKYLEKLIQILNVLEMGLW